MAKSLLSTMTIGGRSLPGDERFEVIDPATGEAFANAPICHRSDLEEAIGSAQKAFKHWATSENLRRNALLSCAERIGEIEEQLAMTITREQGKPLAEARSEVRYAQSVLEEYAKMPLPGSVLGQNERSRTVLIHKPFGVVGLITPWNFPIGTAVVKLAPALLAGNCVILKPSPYAPLSPLLLGKALRKTLPAGVLNTVSGGDELGSLISRHPAIRKLSVTGSVSTGQCVLKDSAEELKSVTLELGGNDPAILLPDAPVGSIASSLLDAAWRNAGQVCSAIKRVYVHETKQRELIQALCKEAIRFKVGNGLDASTRIGPLTTHDQQRKAQHLSSLVESSCGTLLCEKLPPLDGGYFFPPSIATGLPQDHPLVQEEQFSPILPIVAYQTLDQAIEWSNETNFGLSASIWTSNPKLGYDIATQLECGRVGINGHRRADISAPFGGVKHSGLGRELGEWGLLGMCESQVINVFS
ncbi:aldehyde dehydrogenase family protein [Pelagicoccus sp. SDUM812003]|uniref:aldehyde dehydrogenase family protein n=1 Tax=Pelagicoccus sp. SDUM812003 TaxID=3041267 RepID=UPI00280C4B50|nr:aldehyde dehydrogenase family protein [Pelagicoccus sp. SDUM812003]MDQ8204072.1 aldehyde dehydrogenase family protein [Pelagicoccus sp. SDUM812003]